MRGAPFVGWFEAKEGALVLGSQDVEKAVGALTDVTDPLMQIVQHRFTPKLLPLTVEYDPLNLSGILVPGPRIAPAS